MSGIYLNDADRRRLVKQWLNITMWALHAWASMLVIAALYNRSNADAIVAMFSTVTFGIGATLAILLLDKAADFVLQRFSMPSAPPVPVTETVTQTRTVSPAAAPEPTTQDVTMKVEGDVNVSKA